MARSRIPNALDRRHLIEKTLSPAQALQLADAYLAEGRTAEAIVFLAKAGAEERLAELRAAAVAAGDVFLLRSVTRALDVAPSVSEWSEIAAKAEAAGLSAYAAEARRQIEREAG